LAVILHCEIRKEAPHHDITQPFLLEAYSMINNQNLRERESYCVYGYKKVTYFVVPVTFDDKLL